MAIAGTTGWWWWWVFCLKVRYALALVGLGCDQYQPTYYVMWGGGPVGVIQIMTTHLVGWGVYIGLKLHDIIYACPFDNSPQPCHKFATTSSQLCHNLATTLSQPRRNLVSTSSQPRCNLVSTSSQPCRNPITTLSQPHRNPIATPSQPCCNLVAT